MLQKHELQLYIDYFSPQVSWGECRSWPRQMMCTQGFCVTTEEPPVQNPLNLVKGLLANLSNLGHSGKQRLYCSCLKINVFFAYKEDTSSIFQGCLYTKHSSQKKKKKLSQNIQKHQEEFPPTFSQKLLLFKGLYINRYQFQSATIVTGVLMPITYFAEVI